MLQLVVLNSEGRDYSLEVPTEMTVERVKKMAVGHFFNPAEAVGGSIGDDRVAVDGSKSTTGNRTYRLVLVREARPLAETNSIQLEKLMDNGKFFFVCYLFLNIFRLQECKSGDKKLLVRKETLLYIN